MDNAQSESFYEFIKQQVGRDDPVGDFAEDTIRVKGAPIMSNSKDRWEGFLIHKRACTEAIKAFRVAWREYKKLQMDKNQIC